MDVDKADVMYGHADIYNSPLSFGKVAKLLLPNNEVGVFINDLIMDYIKDYGSANVEVLASNPSIVIVQITFNHPIPPSHPTDWNKKSSNFMMNVDTVKNGFHIYTLRGTVSDQWWDTDSSRQSSTIIIKAEPMTGKVTVPRKMLG